MRVCILLICWYRFSVVVGVGVGYVTVSLIPLSICILACVVVTSSRVCGIFYFILWVWCRLTAFRILFGV